jgi:RHS repeat-associated protein
MMSQFIRVLATFFVSLLCLNTLANETVTFYHHDALGSTIAATDANGDTLWTEEYTPYGNRIENKNNAANPFWYTGKQEEMGLNYFQARWYDPKLGRFLSPDPVEFNAANLQSFNRYAYANNNPYMYIDPDGNVAIKLITLGLDFVDFSAAMVAGNYADAGLTLLTMADPTGLGTLARRAAKAKKIADKASVTKGGDDTIDVYRAFGGDARAQGFSWTTKDPRKVDNYRDAAGLPSGGESGATNTADFLIKGRAKASDIIESRSALPLDGNKGGLPELIIDPKNVNLTGFSVLKP